MILRKRDASKGKLNFEVAANLQKLIGKELVSNDEMALIELIKNAYDSGALAVDISIHQETVTNPAYVTVRDNGHGMTLPEFTTRFIFRLQSARGRSGYGDKNPNWGEGYRQTASDKIGAELIVITKPAGAKDALSVTFDWNAFRQKNKKFNEISAPYSRVPSPLRLPRAEQFSQLRSSALNGM